MTTTKRTVIRERTDEHGAREWCALEVELREDQEGRPVLSICGSAGYVLTYAQAKKEALQYWESYFEDEPSQMKDMGERLGRKFRTARGAARFVLATDGELHGLDVYRETATGDKPSKVYVTHSCGQIREELLSFFPEVQPYLKWHLNNMRVSPARTERVTDAWGNIKVIGIPEGASWDYEPLPPEVIAWAEGLPATLGSKS